MPHQIGGASKQYHNPSNGSAHGVMPDRPWPVLGKVLVAEDEILLIINFLNNRLGLA
jgi:hypothetical protein